MIDSLIRQIQALDVSTEYAVIKPNWVSNRPGEFTSAGVLAGVLSALPKKQKKLVVESYTPWRGAAFADKEAMQSLEAAKPYWPEFRAQDERFLTETGMAEVLREFGVEYVNVTNEVWAGRCAPISLIQAQVEAKFGPLSMSEFYGYFPARLQDIGSSATLISLARVKLEQSVPAITVSLSIKNLFGLIPHPSRRGFHGANHQQVPLALADIYKMYVSAFLETVWINEDLGGSIANYCTDSQKLTPTRNFELVGRNALTVDSTTCREFGVDPTTVPYFQLIP